MRPHFAVVLVEAWVFVAAGTLSAQTPKHLNPVIEKLAAGKPFIGFQTGDLFLVRKLVDFAAADQRFEYRSTLGRNHRAHHRAVGKIGQLGFGHLHAHLADHGQRF